MAGSTYLGDIARACVKYAVQSHLRAVGTQPTLHYTEPGAGTQPTLQCTDLGPAARFAALGSPAISPDHEATAAIGEIVGSGATRDHAEPHPCRLSINAKLTYAVLADAGQLPCTQWVPKQNYVPQITPT